MNNRDRALEAFERVLHVNPANIHAMTQVGAVLAKKERYTQAVGYLQRAIAAESTCGEAWAVLAHCYVMTDDLPKAYQAYQNALNHLQDPSDPNLWYGIGLLYDRYGSLDNALEAFLAVLRIAPNFERAIEVCFCIGIIYKEQRKLDEAMSYFNKVSLAPNPPPPLTRADGWYQIGHVNELKRNIPKALEMYQLALRENPSHAKTLQNLGWLEHSHKDSSREAIRLLQLSLDADPNDGQTWYLLGRVYMALREFRQAYDAYQQAVYRDGRNATFWCSIGVLYYQMNQYRDAMDAYARAIRLNPLVSEVWYDLGTLYESCGQTNDAIDAYRRAAELAPDSTQITERLNVLQNSLNQGNATHTQQQSQPMTSQPPLQQPHPQLPPPQAHLQNNQARSLPQQQLGQPDQIMQGQPGTTLSQSLPQTASQTALPPPVVHSQQQQQQHQQMVQNHQLQPIGGLRHGMQQPIPMLSQNNPPHSSGHQPLPRHFMQHPLQQPPGAGPPVQGSTGLPGPPQAHPLRGGPLPHLSIPGQGAQNSTASPATGPQAGTTQRVDQVDPRAQISSGQPTAHLSGSRPNSLTQPLPQPNSAHRSGPLSHGLPQLPSIQSQQEGQNNSSAQVEQKREDAQNGNLNQQPQLPHLRIGGKEGAPNTLEQIPSLHRPDGPGGFGQNSSRPVSMNQNHLPIPSLAPLMQDNKQGPEGQASLPGSASLTNQRPHQSGPITDSNNTGLKTSPLPPLQHQGEQKPQDHGSGLPPVSAPSGDGRGQMDAQMNNGNRPSGQDGSPKGSGLNDVNNTDVRQSQPNGGPLRPQSEDVKLLQSVALGSQSLGSSPKRSLPPPPTSVGQPGASSSPPIPTLPIRSAPAPRQNKENPELRLSGLGASSLTKFGRSQPTPLTNSKLPSTLPSPLAPSRKDGDLRGTSSRGLLSSPMNSAAVPPILKSVPNVMNSSNSNVEALPSPSSLPVLPGLTGKVPDSNTDENRGMNTQSDNKIPALKSQPTEGDKKLNGSIGLDPANNPHDKPMRPFSGMRSVPISSLAGNDVKGSNSPRESVMQIPSSNKREVSPGVDADKTYKRPRVNDGGQHEDDGSRLGRRRSEDNERDENRHGENDVRMSEGNGRDDSNRDSLKAPGDGRMGTPLASDPQRSRSLTPRDTGHPLQMPKNGPLPSFRSSREGRLSAGKTNSFGAGDTRMKSPVLGITSRSPGPLHLRSAPIPQYSIPKSQQPMNLGRPREPVQGGRSYNRVSPRSGDSEEKGLARSDSKNIGQSSDEVRRDGNSGDKDHGASDSKATETTGTAS